MDGVHQPAVQESLKRAPPVKECVQRARREHVWVCRESAYVCAESMFAQRERLSELSDYCRTVRQLSDCRTVGLSDDCRTIDEHLLRGITVGHCRTTVGRCRTVGLSDMSDCRKTVGHCRTLLSDCRTGAQVSDPTPPFPWGVTRA